MQGVRRGAESAHSSIGDGMDTSHPMNKSCDVREAEKTEYR